MVRWPLLPTPLRAAAARAVVADRAPSHFRLQDGGEGWQSDLCGFSTGESNHRHPRRAVSHMPVVLGHLRGIAKGQLERQMEGFAGGGGRKTDAASGHWTAPKPRGFGARFAQRA